jgi:hypothetical protein
MYNTCLCFIPTDLRPNSWTSLGKSLRVFPLLFTVISTNGFYSPSPLSNNGLTLVSNVNIVYGNLLTENSQDYAQKPQQNYTFMISASELHVYLCVCRHPVHAATRSNTTDLRYIFVPRRLYFPALQ